MLKNRKPLFVSPEALQLLQQTAKEMKLFTGDVVDILLGIKTEEQLEVEYRENALFSKRVGRLPKKINTP